MTTTAAAAAQAASQAEAASSKLGPMQQELLNRADKIFDWIGNSVEKVGDLAIQGGKAVAEQIPDIAFQYVAYARASLTFYVLLGFFMYFVMYYSVIRVAMRDSMNIGTVQNWTGPDWHPMRYVIGIGGGASAAIVGSLLVFTNLKELFLVWFAPKVWLMLELVHLIKIVKS